MKHYGSCGWGGGAEMQTYSMLWGACSIVLTLSLVFGLAFGGGYSRDVKTTGAPGQPLEAPGPASIPATQPAPASKPVVWRLGDSVNMLDDKVDELREAVTRLKRHQNR